MYHLRFLHLLTVPSTVLQPNGLYISILEIVPFEKMSIDHSLLWGCADIDGEVPSTDSLFSDIKMIELGSVYELNHIYLPPRTPAHLRSIRVAMVINCSDYLCLRRISAFRCLFL